MQSRGIERDAAERTIALGFFEPAVEHFPTKTLRDEIRARDRRETANDAIRRSPSVEQIVADFPILSRPTSRGKRLVYLDSAATSQKPRAVIDALVTYYKQYNANIHRGVYEIAARATDAYENARVEGRSFRRAPAPSEIVWTRNTTEAINLVAYSWGDRNLRAGDAILLTELEHHSNLVPWQLLAAATGAELRFIPVDERGLHVLDDLDALLDGCKIVALGHVSNTLGTIAPLEDDRTARARCRRDRARGRRARRAPISGST